MIKINVTTDGNTYTHDVHNNADAIALAAHAGFMQAMTSDPFTTGKNEWDMWQQVIEILTAASNAFIINTPGVSVFDLEV